MEHSLFAIALTPGEPAGIGPDLCIQLAQLQHPCQLVAIADPQMLSQRASLLGLPLHIRLFDQSTVSPHQSGSLVVLPVELAETAQCGQLNPANSSYVLETVRVAANGCLSGRFAAMVTAPVHKAIINDAGFPYFSGHTEFIADITGGKPVMMLATPKLRVALATTHLPLSQVSSAISQESLTVIIRQLNKDLQVRFGISQPKILVCGLNPHAGEGGHLGHEEIDIIEPVISQLKTEGVNLFGPLPADSVFTAKYLDTADVVLAMYHDQGLPVLKHSGFGHAVNITLGLPIIRTSVDHGTALDLAGLGKASSTSLQYALTTAIEMVKSNQMP